jgi:small redox-active disulfide protein 2
MKIGTEDSKAYFRIKKLQRELSMDNDDIIQIKIGTFQVGIIGLKEVMADLASSLDQALDEEVSRELIRRLSKKNYIPEKATAEYGRAFLKEFKKYLGRPVIENEPTGLTIRVLGQGCPNCQALTQRIMEILSELKLPADFEHVTDIKEIAHYGVLQSPALVINGNVVARGTVPGKAQLIEWFRKAAG